MTAGRVVSVVSGAILFALLLIVFRGNAGPDPAKWLLHQSGIAAIVFLVATLSVSTIARAARNPTLVLWRRPIGLSSFFFATTHVAVYAVLYQGLLWSAIVEDVLKRPYIIIGAVAWLMLLSLAITSTRRARRRMGRWWTMLHRTVYVIVPLAILHQGFAQKADISQTLVFLLVSGCFLIALN